MEMAARSRELGSRSITANVVAPGYVRTDMTAVRPGVRTNAVSYRPGVRRAQEVAVVTWLASEAAVTSPVR